MSEKDFRNVDLSEIIEKLQIGMSFTTTFDGKSIEALCLDITDEGKIVMLFPEIKELFDIGGHNSWKDSPLRAKLNSDDFFCKFENDFINHIVVKEVHTCDYITNDRFWLLSHEEVGSNKNYFRENHLCKKLKYFDESDKSRCFDEMFWSAFGWWLRSATSDSSYNVGYVCGGGFVSYNSAYNNIAVLPVCLIR